MAQQMGPITWNLGQPEEKQQLTGEMIEKKTAEVTKRFSDLVTAFGLGVTLLADEGDPLALYCLSVITKQLLADGADRCADIVDKVKIIE